MVRTMENKEISTFPTITSPLVKLHFPRENFTTNRCPFQEILRFALNDSMRGCFAKDSHCFALGDLSTSLEMTVHFYHHNKIRLSGFYFTFLRKISSTQWISPVKDGFHCEALLRLRGFLHALRLVEMTTKK